MPSYSDLIRHLQSSQTAFRIIDGRIHIADPSQLPWAYRQLLDAAGFLDGDTLPEPQGYLVNDPDPRLGSDLQLNGHRIVGDLNNDCLVVDGGLL